LTRFTIQPRIARMQSWAGWCVLASLLAAPPFACAETREPVAISVPFAPAPVAIDGRQWLIYELQVANGGSEAIQITSVEVLTGDARSLQTFGGEDLASRMAPVVRAGERAIAYLEVAVDAKRPPRTIRHRVRFTTGEVAGAEFEVRARAGLALGPPLRGGPWAAVYAWEWPRGHRRVFYTVDSRERLPGRLAIDWVRKDSQGHSARGDADIVANSLGYGADVLAVADARVAAVRDGITESERVSANPKHAPDEAAGNFIALDLGEGRFAIYEHLKPGSIRVVPGDRVRRGQVIALLGFTGDSTEPHLHFHVADGPSPLAGEGLPFEFDRFRVESGGTPVVRERERPAPNALVTFP
jgi:murein DD-endopeptidase MepM/ murein hydrolase activator NlpD